MDHLPDFPPYSTIKSMYKSLSISAEPEQKAVQPDPKSDGLGVLSVLAVFWLFILLVFRAISGTKER